MTTLSEGNYTAEFCLSEANGKRSRETITVLSGQNIGTGQVLGKVTASGKYVAYDETATDGSETAVGVLYADVDASAADAVGVAFVRDAEVAASKLVWGTADDAAGTIDLAAVGVVAR